MAPPKKDAFSDLFRYAHGSSKNSSSSSMNDLAQKNQAKAYSRNAPEKWADSDVLSPQSTQSPVSSQSQTPGIFNLSISNSPPIGATKNLPEDPFAIFNAPSISSPATGAKDVVQDDPFGFFEENPKKPGKVSDVKVDTKPLKSNSARSGIIQNDVALLDDEFTDAFVLDEEPSPQEPASSGVASEAEEMADDFSFMTTEEHNDHVLAVLVSEGFPVEVANDAIRKVGPDVHKCAEHILKINSRTARNPRPTPQKELGDSLQDMSSDLYKKASWLFDRSKKTVIKNISNFQQHMNSRAGDDGMPAWIRNQDKYKGMASELNGEGNLYQDYGTDADNIDKAKVQRIIKAQRQKDLERQRQRMANVGNVDDAKEHKRSSFVRPNSETTYYPEPVDFSNDATPRGKPHTKSSSSSLSFTPVSQNASNPVERVSTPRAEPKTDSVEKTENEEFDLLGLNSAPPKENSSVTNPMASSEAAQGASSSAHSTKSKSCVQRPASSEPLNAFAQSDYETYKEKGTSFFTNGDYNNALTAYSKCLDSLPASHELRIVITSNLALTCIKIGDYKSAKQYCEQGMALIGDAMADVSWYINGKNAKYWYVKLLTRKAESLELIESFPSALECYMSLISKYGVTDKKVMDAKRRVNNVVHPPAANKKSEPKPSEKSKTASFTNEKTERIKKQHQKEKLEEERKFRLHDQVYAKVAAWSSGKEDNLRSLLMSLDAVIPQHLGFSFVADRKITMNDLMLTKKVKINYMKVISNIHPDKLESFALEDQMICSAVFVTLNKAWDEFKKQNNIA